MARPPLTVRRSPTGFVVHDPALAHLFGRDALPLPFTPEADPATVLRHLRRANPGRPVLFDDPAPPDSRRRQPPTYPVPGSPYP